MNITGSRVIVALDFDNEKQARLLASSLDPRLCRLKIGKQLFTISGPALVEHLQSLGFDVFLDLKFHDIPNTVASACAAAAGMGVWMMNVHASGGPDMLAAARSVCAGRSRLIGVTVLTSMDQETLTGLGIQRTVQDQVLFLAGLCRQAGLDGVVCSAQEAAVLRAGLGEDFLLVTPGIRPAGSQTDDQSRIMTPARAIEAGASFLVIGRPITLSSNPIEALEAVNKEVAAALLKTGLREQMELQSS